MLAEEISEDTPLFPGDVIEMHFKAFGPNWVYLRAAELAILKWRMEQKNPDYELISWQAPGDKLIMTFRIIANPALTAGIILAIVIGGGLFAWLSLDKIYRISSSPAGQIAMAGGGAVGLVFAVFVGYLVLSYFFGFGRGD